MIKYTTIEAGFRYRVELDGELIGFVRKVRLTQWSNLRGAYREAWVAKTIAGVKLNGGQETETRKAAGEIVLAHWTARQAARA